MTKQYDYEVKKKQQYPLYELKNAVKHHQEHKRLCAKIVKGIDVYNRNKEAYGEHDESVKEIREGLDKRRYERDDLEKGLSSGSIYADQSIETVPFKPRNIGFSVGNLCGRHPITNNTVRIISEKYNVTTVAPTIEEYNYSLESTPNEFKFVELNDCASVIKTSNLSRITFNDVIRATTVVYDDELKETLDDVITSAHNRHIINAENKRAFEVMIESKEGINVSGVNMDTAINANLCGDAKKKAIIVTNKNGFAKLDVDVNGIPQITKDDQGNMVYKHKYIVEEVPNEVLPDTENGSPYIVGDIENILDFYIIYNDSLIRDDMTYIDDRKTVTEIITLNTTSDEAYIHGVLA